MTLADQIQRLQVYVISHGSLKLEVIVKADVLHVIEQYTPWHDRIVRWFTKAVK